jgi:hypothetical protein
MAIAFDQEDHPDRVPHLGCYLLVVSPIVGTTCLAKVLMDGASSLNILYTNTLNKMGISRCILHPSKVSFYRIIPGKEALPLGCIRLNITIGQPDNFHKELLTFEVVDFPSIYHILLGRPCFAKFMAVPNYTYLSSRCPAQRGSSPLRAASSKPTTMSRNVSPKKPRSSSHALPMALATTQEGYQWKEQPRRQRCSTDQALARRPRLLAAVMAWLTPPSRCSAPQKGSTQLR